MLFFCWNSKNFGPLKTHKCSLILAALYIGLIALITSVSSIIGFFVWVDQINQFTADEAQQFRQLEKEIQQIISL
uniref:Uncharacterized protein n=1 Tax=Ditylenchus dipsaci TaxID=166011 RepID=A0A915EG54_9BILA